VNNIKKAIAAAILAAAHVSATASDVFAPQSPPLFADTEVSTNVQLSAQSNLVRRFEVCLELVATPSNNVVAAFGTDADGDGALSRRETALSFGWDCGEWFVECNGSRTTSAAGGGGAPSRREMSLVMSLGSDGSVRGVKAAEGAMSLPAIADSAGLALCAPSEWDFAKVTARGVDAPGGFVSLRRASDPTIFLAR